MNPLQLIRELASDVVVERLGWVLVHSLWQFTLIAFVAAIVVRLLGRNRAAARYAVLFGAMAALVVSPMATWFLQPEWVAIAEVAPVADGATAPIATGAAPAAADECSRRRARRRCTGRQSPGRGTSRETGSAGDFRCPGCGSDPAHLGGIG